MRRLGRPSAEVRLSEQERETAPAELDAHWVCDNHGTHTDRDTHPRPFLWTKTAEERATSLVIANTHRPSFRLPPVELTQPCC